MYTKTEFMKAKDVVEYFGVTRNTVQNWIKNNDMPHYRVGRILLFKEEELLEWMSNRKVTKWTYQK